METGTIQQIGNKEFHRSIGQTVFGYGVVEKIVYVKGSTYDVHFKDYMERIYKIEYCLLEK